MRLAYREDVERALGVMQQLAVQLREDPSYGPRILDEPEIVGVDRLEESAVILRLRFMVRPLEQWNVRREYLRRLKKRFDAEGIEIPSPQLTVHAAADTHGGAASAALRPVPAGDSSVQPGAP